MANKSRPKQIIFRVSDEEELLLKKKIEESGKTQQEYILGCVLDKPIINTDGIREIFPELKRQGNNLNQISKKLNERKYVDYSGELQTTLREVKEVWQLLKQYLHMQA